MVRANHQPEEKHQQLVRIFRFRLLREHLLLPKGLNTWWRKWKKVTRGISINKS